MVRKFENVTVRNQLGRPEDMGIGIKQKEEILILEEGPTQIWQANINNAFILGHSVNGVIGATGKNLGADNYTQGDVIRVVNPFDTFIEHFRYTHFRHLTSTNTAYWNTTDYNLAMSTSNNHAVMYNTVANFDYIFLDSRTVYSVTLSCSETKWNSNDVIEYWISADDGSNWEQVQNNEKTDLSYPGDKLLLQIRFKGNGGKSTFIEDLKVKYE